MSALNREHFENGDMDNIVQDSEISLVFSSSSEEEEPETIVYGNVINVPVNAHQCTLCDRSFSLQGGLTRHLNRTHGQKSKTLQPKRAQCKICRRVFKNNYSVFAHQKVHTRERQERITPTLANKPQIFALKTKRKWRNVLRSKTTTKTLSAPIKPRPSKPKKAVELPVQEKVQHPEQVKKTKSLVNQCTECCLVFKDPNLLSLHIMTHKDDRLYKCGRCEAYFLDLIVYSQHKC